MIGLLSYVCCKNLAITVQVLNCGQVFEAYSVSTEDRVQVVTLGY